MNLPTPSITLPYSSRRRIFRWFKERFGLKQRKLFWIVFVMMGLLTIYNSGILLSIFIFGAIYLLSAVPILRPFANDMIMGPLQPWLGQHIEYMCIHSPIDNLLRTIGFSATYVTVSPFFNEIICILVPCIAAYFLIRAYSRPGELLVTSDGIQLLWPFKLKGPLVHWNDIKKVSFIRPAETTTQSKSLIAFECNSLPLLYRLTEKMTAATKGKICLQLRNIESDKDREGLSRMLQTHAPAVDTAVLENLTPAQNQSYTELWLGALTAPSKRERVEPLKSGMKLNAGRFEVVGQLGVGGQGTAYLAQSNETKGASMQADGADIVLKEFVLPLYVDTDSRKVVLEKFVKEAEILKSLDNPRIVKLMDCFIEDHRCYLVLERIKGNTLKDLVLSGGPMTELRVSSLLHQMCEMLEYLHCQSPPVVHRDFAPDNLILSEDGTLKLVDFNVAQQAEDAFTGSIVGKQSYVPPEQLRGMATPQSDIYALGATLYFLLTGEDPEPLSESHPREKFPHISEQLDEIVARCTRLDEETRFKSAAEIANSLRITIPWAEEVEKQKR